MSMGIFFGALGSKSSAHRYLALHSGFGKRAFLPPAKHRLLRFRVFDQGKQGHGQRGVLQGRRFSGCSRHFTCSALETRHVAVVREGWTGVQAILPGL